MLQIMIQKMRRVKPHDPAWEMRFRIADPR